MDERLMNLISDKPIIVPKIFLKNYRKLNITETEFIVILVIMEYGMKMVYDPISISNELNMDKMRVMETISNLVEKNLLSIISEKSNRKTLEYISLDLLYKKLINIIKDVPEKEVTVSGSVFEIFEKELGKTLSPMQYEQIKEWTLRGVSEELIIEALKEAVINGTNNFRYIDTIISKWMDKGYKCKSDVLKDKEMYRSKKIQKVQVFDTDWLNDE